VVEGFLMDPATGRIDRLEEVCVIPVTKEK